MIRTDRSDMLQLWYQVLHEAGPKVKAEAEQVMQLTEDLQTEPVKSASPNSNVIDVCA
tara:strand:+ start:1425 stop:1598 length:174 start_codon:yes stop_codon:yes gene_type:complete